MENKIFPVVISGVEYSSIADMAKQSGIDRTTIYTRIKNNWPTERWLQPIKKRELPKWVKEEPNGHYTYSRVYKGQTVTKTRETLAAIKDISQLVHYYIKVFDSVPHFDNELQTIDYNSLLGQVFGELTVLGVILKDNKRQLLCQCSCGKEVYYKAHPITTGRIISCGHREGWALKEKNNQLKEIQRQTDKPLVTNKTTGHKNISYNKNKAAYDVELRRFGVLVRRRFKTLTEAIAFKKDLLEAIEQNDGKIPEKYL